MNPWVLLGAVLRLLYDAWRRSKERGQLPPTTDPIQAASLPAVWLRYDRGKYLVCAQWEPGVAYIVKMVRPGQVNPHVAAEKYAKAAGATFLGEITQLAS